MKIFGTEAPKYWAKGLSVTPVRGKAAFEKEWQKYHDVLPSAETQADWTNRHAGCNIGLVVGKQSGIMILDVDTKDPVLLAAIEKVLPPSPWVRIGSKGYAVAYRWSGEPNRRIKDEFGSTIVEFFGSKLQIVLPPSIHPDTHQPYTANCHLLDVLDQLQPLPDHFMDRLMFELQKHVKLEQKSGSENFRAIDFISAGSRDVSMTRYAGLLAHEVMVGKTTLKEALEMMQSWGENHVQQVAGDPLDINKGMNHIIQFMLRDVNQRGKIVPTGWDEGMTQEQRELWGVNFSVDQEAWTYQKLREYAEEQFHLHNEENSPQRFLVIEYLLKKIHQSQSLTVLEVDKILTFIVKHGGTGMTISSYRKRLKEIGQGAIKGVNHTEIAQAAIKEFYDKVGEIRFANDDFWKWDGSHWTVVTNGEIERIVAQEYGHLDAARKYNDISGIRKSMQNLVPNGIRTLPVEGVNFANGFLTTDLKLLPHNPDYGMTYTMPYRYMPGLYDKAHRFMAYLQAVWGPHPDFKEKCIALAEAFSVTLFGIAPRYQKCFCLYGPGQSGKSQILDIVSLLVPDDARSAVAPTTWQETFVPAELQGKLLNVCGELPENGYIDGANFKTIVSGDELQVQFKRKALFKLRPKAAHWFLGNFLPRSRDTTNGFNRRWQFLEFERMIEAQERVIDIGKSIAQEEIEAIVAWAISFFPDLMKRQSFTVPASGQKLVDQMSQLNSSVRAFIKERIVVKPGAVMKNADLYQTYWGHCISKVRSKPIGEKKFEVEMKQILAEFKEFQVKLEAGDQVYINLGVTDV